MLERSQPKSWEPPLRLGSGGANGSGLVWSADGERRSLRVGSGPRLSPIPRSEPPPELLTHACEPCQQADLDTFLSSDSMAAARHAAGAVCEAIDHVMRGTCRNAFVAARPPGHHAGVSGVALGAPSQGFCLINNVAIGCVRLRTQDRDSLRTHHGPHPYLACSR